MGVGGSIGVPSVRGMKDAFIDYAVGAGGGLLMALSRSIFGNGLIGSLAAPVLAGSIIKGSRGQILATVAGYSLFAGGGSAPAASADNSAQEEVM
jgi:hypothetical protein